MGGNQAVRDEKRERKERSAFPIRVRLARLTGVRKRGGGVCGDKEKRERHVPNDLWGELLP